MRREEETAGSGAGAWPRRGRGFTERFLLFNSSPYLVRDFRKRQAGRQMGGALPPCILAGGRKCSPIIAARVALPPLCNEISPALFVIRACIMAFFPADDACADMPCHAMPAPLISDSSEQIADVSRRRCRRELMSRPPDDGRDAADEGRTNLREGGP